MEEGEKYPTSEAREFWGDAFSTKKFNVIALSFSEILLDIAEHRLFDYATNQPRRGGSSTIGKPRGLCTFAPSSLLLSILVNSSK